jgi:hypothetical protein
MTVALFEHVAMDTGYHWIPRICATENVSTCAEGIVASKPIEMGRHSLKKNKNAVTAFIDRLVRRPLGALPRRNGLNSRRAPLRLLVQVFGVG